MAVDVQLFWAFLVAFVRASALCLQAPVFGSRLTPAPVRIGLSAVLAAGLAPLIKSSVGAPPAEWILLMMRLVAEALIGLVMGYGVSLIIGAAAMAGELLDMKMGFGLMQLLNPVSSFPTSLLAQFHYLLAMTLFALVDGHHLLLMALARSFEASGGIEGLVPLAEHGMHTMTWLASEMMVLCLQIAAPAGGVLLVVDAAMAAVSRAVPQVPVWLIGMPAKIAIGFIALGASLPALVSLSLRLTDLSARFLGEWLKMLGL
ncbi:MAG: flagellar biosynthetic protein FliR [Armatimonadota bacterium]